MHRSELPPPKTLRDWLIGIAVALLLGAALLAAYQPWADRGEEECRAKCAADGAKGYDYRGSGKSRPRCTCLKK